MLIAQIISVVFFLYHPARYYSNNIYTDIKHITLPDSTCLKPRDEFMGLF